MSKIGAAALAVVLALCGLAIIGLEARTANAQEARAQVVTSGPDAPIEQGDYVNRDGAAVHQPAHTVSGHPPIGATAECQDGSFSYSAHHRGACSRHGGVLRWLEATTGDGNL
jgi:hypothetical protein